MGDYVPDLDDPAPPRSRYLTDMEGEISLWTAVIEQAVKDAEASSYGDGKDMRPTFEESLDAHRFFVDGRFLSIAMTCGQDEEASRRAGERHLDKLVSRLVAFPQRQQVA